MSYVFRCNRCGEYPVNKKTFRKFLTKKKRQEVQRALDHGAEGAVIEFGTKCPKCVPKASGQWTIKVLWPKSAEKNN